MCRKSQREAAGVECRRNRVGQRPDRKLSDFTLRAEQSGPVRQGQGKPVQIRAGLPEFRTSELCQSMKVILERNGRYLIRLESTEFVPRRQYPGCRGVLLHGSRGRVAKGPDGRRRSAAPGIDPALVSGGGAHGRNRRRGKLPGPGSHRRIPDQRTREGDARRRAVSLRQRRGDRDSRACTRRSTETTAARPGCSSSDNEVHRACQPASTFRSRRPPGNRRSLSQSQMTSMPTWRLSTWTCSAPPSSAVKIFSVLSRDPTLS